MGSPGARTAAIALAVSCTALLTAQSASPGRSGIGRVPAPEALRAIDIDVMPDGRGLPPGRGTAAQGRAVYAVQCASCHGAKGEGGSNDPLVGGQGSLASGRPLKTVGSFWPYATTLWDYVNRSMPFDRPGSLSPDEVYAVTAHVLHLNGLVDETSAIDQTTLPQVRMPNRDGFVPDRRPDVEPSR